MKRRKFLALSAAPLALAMPRLATAAEARVLKVVPTGDFGSLDPVWTTAMGTRNHAYMVYDTLYGVDDALRPSPQMVEGHVIEEGGLRWTLTLRAGLRFHDGEPVRAQDAAASVRRWMHRAPFGQALAEAAAEISAADDRRLVFRLHRPFPLLPDALGAAGAPAFIMPERIASTDPYKQIHDATGSGPFRFMPKNFDPGSLVVYEKFAEYVPAPADIPSLTAGPKRAWFDRVEWHIISDAGTASAALQAGEVDWFEAPGPELQELFARLPALRVEPLARLGTWAFLRLNWLQPPFNDRAVRRALLPAINQAEFMTAIVGPDPTRWQDGVGVFTPDTPMANKAGLGPLLGPRDPGKAREMLKAAGAAGAKLRLIGPSGTLSATPMTDVAGALFRSLGFNSEIAISDWGTVVQRRASHEPIERGGWSALTSSFTFFDAVNPGVHPLLRGNGVKGWPGWPTIPELQGLRRAWLEATDEAGRRAACEKIQKLCLDEVAFIPLGSFLTMTALRRNLSGRVPGLPVFWNIRRE